METVETNVEDGVFVLRLNRPKKYNALNVEMIRDVRAALGEANEREDVRCILITGNGRAFCAGADLTVGPLGTDPQDSRGIAIAHAFEYRWNPMMKDLANTKVPTVAYVNGIAAGGGVGLALACDMVIMAESSRFRLVFVPQLGILPDLGVTQSLTRAVGRQQAMGILFLGEDVPARRAHAMGLVWEVLADDAGYAGALARAKALARGPTEAYLHTRRAVDASYLNSFSAQLALERDSQRTLLDRPEFDEGVQAFLEKRPPRFDRLAARL